MLSTFGFMRRLIVFAGFAFFHEKVYLLFISFRAAGIAETIQKKFRLQKKFRSEKKFPTPVSAPVLRPFGRAAAGCLFTVYPVVQHMGLYFLFLILRLMCNLVSNSAMDGLGRLPEADKRDLTPKSLVRCTTSWE